MDTNLNILSKNKTCMVFKMRHVSQRKKDPTPSNKVPIISIVDDGYVDFFLVITQLVFGQIASHVVFYYNTTIKILIN